MKIAVKITKTLERTVVVEANNYKKAEEKVLTAFYNGKLPIHDYNSTVGLDCANDTEVDLETRDISDEFK